MTGVLERAKMAVNGAVNGAVQGWRGNLPMVIPAQNVELLRLPTYAQRWAYYDNSVFDDSQLWAPLYRKAGLYNGMRPIYNPVRRIVDFYVSNVYPGILSEDGANLPENVPSAIPLAADMDRAHKAAIGQLWQWGNWQALKDVIVRRGAAKGDLLVDIDDDVDGGKIRYVAHQPEDVVWLDLEADNLKGYALEYYTSDKAGRYLFTKVVTKEVIQKYRDDTLVADYVNPYPFIPARWIKHKDIGFDRGVPAPYGTYPKVDHLASLASHMHDQVHRIADGTLALITPTDPTPLMGATVNEDGTWRRDPGETLVIALPLGSSTAPFIPDMPLGDVNNMIVNLLQEIKDDHPEISAIPEVRGITDPTGPAIRLMLRDVEALLLATEAQYDSGVASLLQMGVAIAGWRYQHRNDSPPDSAERNGWADNTTAQQKFASFDFESYDKGRNTVVITPRPLVTPSRTEQAQARSVVYASVNAAVAAGLTRADALGEAGVAADVVGRAVSQEKERQQMNNQLAQGNNQT